MIPEDYSHCTTPKSLSSPPLYPLAPSQFAPVLLHVLTLLPGNLSSPSFKQSVLLLPFALRALGTSFSMLTVPSQCNYLCTRLSPILGYEFLKRKRQVLSIFNNTRPPAPMWGLVKQDSEWQKDIHAYLWVRRISVWKSKILILSLPEKVRLALVSMFSYKSNPFSWILSFNRHTNSSCPLGCLRITWRAF